MQQTAGEMMKQQQTKAKKKWTRWLLCYLKTIYLKFTFSFQKLDEIFEAEKSVLVEIQFRALRLMIAFHLIGTNKVHSSHIDELIR